MASGSKSTEKPGTLDQLKKEVVEILRSCDGNCLNISKFKCKYEQMFGRTFEEHYSALLKRKKFSIFMAELDIVELQKNGSSILMKWKESNPCKLKSSGSGADCQQEWSDSNEAKLEKSRRRERLSSAEDLLNVASTATVSPGTKDESKRDMTDPSLVKCATPVTVSPQSQPTSSVENKALRAQRHRTPSQNTKLSTGNPQAQSLPFAEIRQQQAEEEMQFAIGGLPSPHAGHERPLPEMNMPSPAGREHLFPLPKYNETRIREVGTPGPFEKSISHAHNEMNSITSKGKSVRNATFREVNKAAEEIITSLSEKDRFVGLEKVKAALCKEFGKTSLSAFGFRTERDIPALKELIEKQAKVNLFVHAYVMSNSISTLYELNQSLSDLFLKSDFEELNLGPLLKQPVVYDMFKAPQGLPQVPHVTTIQILKHLENYMDKEDLWRKKVDLEKFMEYLSEEYQCGTPFELGVRIQSIGLAISVIKKAKRCESEKWKDIREQVSADMDEEIQRRLQKIKKDLLGQDHGDSRSCVKKFLDTSPSDALKAVSNCCLEMFDGSREKRITQFLTTVIEDSLGRQLFQLALYMSCKRLLGDALENLVNERVKTELEAAANLASHTETDTGPDPPSEGIIVKEVNEWLNKAEHTDLATLASIEENVMNRYSEFDGFEAFGYGSFLKFLMKHKALREAIAEVGGIASSGKRGTGLGLRVSLDSVLDFISQCGTEPSPESIEQYLCDYYNVSKVTDLGFGSAANLVKKAAERKKNLVGANIPSIVYEAALLRRSSGVGDTDGTSLSTRSGGVLGFKSKEEALEAIKSTPLLEDVSLWTHWDEVFGGEVSKLGDLKSFLENEGILLSTRKTSSKSRNPLVVMETSPGVLLRVTMDTSPDMFRECTRHRDVIGATGHLVSMVMMNGGVSNTPVALLANHVQSSLVSMGVDDRSDCDHRSTFVLKCLTRMPLRLARAVGAKVFFEPLKKLVGATEIASLLLRSCFTQSQRDRLHLLGFVLGIGEWRDDFLSRVACKREEDEGLVFGSYSDDEQKRPIAVVKPVAAHISSTLQTETSTESEPEGDIAVSQDQENFAEKAGDEVTSSTQDEFPEVPPTPCAPPTQQEDECKAVIDQIRRDDFGIGIELGEEESKLVQRQREREGRGLARLSSELYSRDTHFVLELVQNADDNSYPEVCSDPGFPSLLFVLERDRIVILNNEIGFEEKNIRALCDVGRSTKGKHRYGYIGQKGIGFKSVFRVTDCPEVHSNGYHIRFDAKSGPIGYILPEWIGGNCSEEKTMEDLGDESNDDEEGDNGGGVSSSGDEFSCWPTRIVLPLNDEHRQNEKSSLAPRFHDIRPSLLLFLHRLRGIFIQDKVHNSRSEMIRKDLGDNIMEIKHTKGTDRWLVIKKQLDASNMKEDVEMTELALAFPLFDGLGSTSSLRIRHQNLPPQNVFAYLPLRSYGFRFIIQGDFEVPSSREDVDSDKSWNQWLREEIPQLFIDALSVFMVHPSFSGLSSVVSYLQFVPLEEEILDFFSPVARHILKLLQSKCCIPVIVSRNETEEPTEADNGKSYNWVLPTEAIFSEDSVIQELITPSLLKEHLGLSYLHPEIVPALNPTLRSRLGIETLSSRHLMDIGRAEVKKASNESDEPTSHSKDCKLDVVRIAWVARWLQCMYRCLEQERNSSQEMLDRIRSLRVIPLTDGTFVNLKEDSIFLPLSLQKISEEAIPKAKKGSKSPEQTTFSVLEKDLFTVHPSLFSSLDDIGRSQVEQLLRSLGVKVWSPKELVNSHIIPTFKSDKWKSRSNEVLRSYLVYILEERLKDPSVCDMDELKSCVQILTNKGVSNPTTTSIHFTPKYGSIIDLAGRLPSISWTLIDESYLDRYAGLKARSTDWKEFLTKLGVKHFLAIKKKQVKIHRDTMAKSPWASYEKIWQTTPDGFYIINDWACEQFEEFLQKIDTTDAKQQISPEESKFLAQCIDERWDDEYAQYAEESVRVEDTNGHNLKETRSSFYLNLITQPWMASTTGGKDFHLPRDLFVQSEIVYQLLENHVKYVAADLKSFSFKEILRIRENVGVDWLMNEMKKWSGGGCQWMDGNQRKEFTTSVAHMSRVYSFLLEKTNHSEVERRKICEAFLKNEMIFVPHRPPSQPQSTRQSAGFFYLNKDVCWTDPTDVSSKLLKEQDKKTTRPLLDMFYGRQGTQESLATFFVDLIRVDATPNVGEYIKMASTVAEVSRFPSPTSLSDMLKIFATLGNKCVGRDHNDSLRFDQQIDEAMANFLKQHLQDDQKCIFPTADKWVALTDKPLIVDDRSLLKIFQKEKSVHFLDFRDFFQPQKRGSSKHGPPNEHELRKHYVSLFLKTCEVTTLSKCIKKEFTPGGSVKYQCVPVQKHFHQLIPCVQRFLYSRYQSEYQELSNQGFAQKLSQMKFATVPNLATVYSLSTHPDVHVHLEEKSGIEEAGDMYCLYVAQEHQDNLEVLNAEIIKLLFGGKKQGASDLNNFLVAVKNYSGNDLDSYLEDKQDLEPLPQDEEQWIVLPPEVPEIVMDEGEEAENEAVPLHKETTTPSRSGDDGLHSWPPKSSAQYDKAFKREGDPGGKPILKTWPLPEPPETIEKPLREENQDYLVQRPTQRDINTTRAPEGMSEKPLRGEDRKTVQDNPGAVVPRQQRTENDAQQPPEVIVEDTLVNNQQISSRETASDLCPNDNENRQQNAKLVEPPPPQVPIPGEITFVTIPGDEARLTSPSRSYVRFDGSPSEIDFEDLQFNGDQRILERIPLVDNPNKEDIGRWGEQCVFEFLQEQARSFPPGSCEIIWMNENENTTTPYDIEIRQHISGVKESDKRTVVTFVEVKTTSSDQKDSFELSVPELQFALKHQVAFHLYRVFNAGKPDIVRIRRLQNLATHLEKKTVKLCMVI